MTTESRSGVGESAFNGIRWTLGSRVVIEVSALAASVVLARLIAPAQFGEAAIALIVVSIASVLAPQSFGAPLVRLADVTREHVETAAFLSLALGVVLSGVTLAFVPLVVDPAFGHATGVLVAMASPIWILSALTTTSLALLQRAMNFRSLAMIELAGRAAGSAVSVVLAVVGFNASAIVLGWLGFASVSLAGYMVAAPPVVPRLHRATLREIASFGTTVSVSTLVYSAFRNVDYAVLGFRLGPTALGFYWRAYQLGVEYQGKITVVMQRVAFPVYSRSDDLAHMLRMRVRIARMHAIVIFPLLGTLIAVAPVAIPAVFGPQWHDAVTPTRFLAVAGMSAAVSAGTSPLLTAAGRPGAMLAFNVVNLVSYAVVIFLVAPFGLDVVSAIVAAYGALAAVAIYSLVSRLLGVDARAIARETVAPVVSTAALIGAAWPVVNALAGSTAVVPLAAATATGGAAYLLVLRYVFPSAFDDLAVVAARLGLERRARSQAAAPARVADPTIPPA